MDGEPVIGGEGGEPVETASEVARGAPPTGAAADDSASASAHTAERDLAERLRAALLAADGDIAPEELAGERAGEVHERYVAARARRKQVPVGAPGRLAQAPGSAFEKIREGLARL